MNAAAPLPRTHARVAPSSLERLFACPGSLQLTAGLPSGPPSVYAAQGTAAHMLAEDYLVNGSDPAGRLGEVLAVDGFDIEVDDEMVEGVSLYLKTVLPGTGPDWNHWIEKKLDLTPAFPDGLPEPIFGTADFIAYNVSTDTLRVADLKYGRLDVSPVGNPQAYTYALGAVFFLRTVFRKLPVGWFPKWVEVTIVQPRGMHGSGVKPETFTGFDLQMWMDNTFVPGVGAMFAPTAPLVAGEHCRFCPGKHICPALAEQAKRISRASFTEFPPAPVDFADDELASVLDWVEVLDQWVNAMRAEASRRLDMGRKIPGYKLVPKRAMRKWVDAKATLDDLATVYGLPLADIAKMVLLSPAQIEKGHPVVYGDLVKRGLIDASSSGTTLVADHDQRMAVTARSSKQAFDVLS